LCRRRVPRGLRRGSAAVLAGIAGSNPALKLGCLSVVSVVRYRPLRPADPLCRGVLWSVCVLFSGVRCNSNLLQLQWVGRGGQTEKRY
jgi:hypothetical protein